MIVRLILGLILLEVVLVSHAKVGIKEIRAYGSVSKQGAYPSKHNASVGLTMNSLHFGIGRSQDSFVKSKYIIYPEKLSKNENISAVASDRSIPGESYGGTVYKILKAKHEKRKGYQYQKPNAASSDDFKKHPSSSHPKAPSSTAAVIFVPATPPQPTSIIAGPTPLPSTAPDTLSYATTNMSTASELDASPPDQYIPPSDPNLFAPNIHAHYPSPPVDGETRFNGITSYLPPAAGPVDDDSSVDSNPPDSPPSNQYIPPPDVFKFPPNIHSHYHPLSMGHNIQTNGLTSSLSLPTGPADTYFPPASGMSADSAAFNLASSPDTLDDTIGTIPISPDSPHPEYLPTSDSQSQAPAAPLPQMMMTMPPTPNMMNDRPPANNMMIGMPPNLPMSSPPMGIPFDFHGYENYYPHNNFPPYFFDHDHYYDHHHDEPLSTTTPEPSPPPAPAKVKNYNYYYISRVFWYFPLYFTLYYAIYIVIIILRSLGRFKVGYPDRLSGKPTPVGWDKIVTRSLGDMPFLTNEQAAYKVDMMAQFVMKQIENFKEKYIG